MSYLISAEYENPVTHVRGLTACHIMSTQREISCQTTRKMDRTLVVRRLSCLIKTTIKHYTR